MVETAQLGLFLTNYIVYYIFMNGEQVGLMGGVCRLPHIWGSLLLSSGRNKQIL